MNPDITMGSKTLNSTFFMVDTKPSYSILLGRDWIHSSQSIPSILYHLLMFLEGNKVEVVPIDANPFSANITVAELIFYSSGIGPIMLIEDYEEGSIKSCDLTHQGFKWNVQSI